LKQSGWDARGSTHPVGVGALPLEPIIEAAHTIKRHWRGVLALVHLPDQQRPFGRHNQLGAAKALARGYRPTHPGLHLGDAHQKQRQPANHHKGNEYDSAFNIRAFIAP